MTDFLNPAGAPTPAGPYSQAVSVGGGGRWLHVSGQIGVDVDGRVAEGVEAQATQAWQNLLAVLAGAGMRVDDLVKLTTYLVDAADLAAVNAVRTRFLGSARPASTLVVAAALAKPEWRFEIEAVAFAAA